MQILSELPAVEICDGITGRVRAGQADKVLWLHGYTLDSSSWGDLWRRLPGWQHIGIDYPGHGGSQPVTQAGTLPELGKRLGAFCIENDIRHIVALSFGTLTAIQIAIEYPNWFSSIVLSAPSLAGGPQDGEVGQVYAKLYRLFFQKGAGPHLAQVWLACKVWNGCDRTPGLVEAIHALVGRHRWDELGSTAMLKLTQPPQDESMLRRIQGQVLVMIGDDEIPAFREVADILGKTLANCQVRELAGAGHLCLLQKPEESAALIDAHLRANAQIVGNSSTPPGFSST